VSARVSARRPCHAERKRAPHVAGLGGAIEELEKPVKRSKLKRRATMDEFFADAEEEPGQAEV
jgi:hypothetical protein